jgi:hypothetical protein
LTDLETIEKKAKGGDPIDADIALALIQIAKAAANKNLLFKELNALEWAFLRFDNKKG